MVQNNQLESFLGRCTCVIPEVILQEEIASVLALVECLHNLAIMINCFISGGVNVKNIFYVYYSNCNTEKLCNKIPEIVFALGIRMTTLEMST